MAWTGVITNRGAALLDQWALGGTLTITGAATGTGTVAEAAMLTQTDLVSRKQTASIVAKEMQSTGLKVKLQITAPQTGYTLQQYGVWAKLGTGDPVLLALFQKPEGVVIPSAAETPDFVYTLYALLTVSNTGELEVTVDPSALVTYSTMEDYVEAVTADMAAHLDRRDNPHQVTPAQLGLEKVLDGVETLGPAELVSFQDAHGGLPLKSCIVGIEPAQSGSGDPSPANIRPISGWTGAQIHVSPTTIAEDGATYAVEWSDEAGTVYSGTLDVLKGTLTVSHKLITLTGQETNWTKYGADTVYVPASSGLLGDAEKSQPGTGNSITGSCSICPSEAAGYIYRGYVEKVSPSGGVQFNNLQARWGLAAGFTVADWKARLQELSAAGTPVQILYKLAAPLSYQLTPEIIATLAGQNRIWADCGEVTVEYGEFLQALQEEIARMSRSRAAKSILSGVEESTTATANYAIGDFLIVRDSLYKVTAAIAAGETITVDTNVQETTIAQQLKALFASV